MTMTWHEFFDRLKQGDVKSVYLFSGPEAYIKREALAKLREALLPVGLEALNETVLEGAGAQAIVEAGETVPFMCDRRLIIVRDFAPLMPGKSKNEEAEAQLVIDWVKTAPDTCTVVFFMRDQFDGRKKLSAALTKTACAVRFDELDDARLPGWIKRYAARAGASIEPGAIDRLIFLGGRALTRLSGEMDKLCAYAGPGGTITKHMVEELVSPSLESTVFQMIDALMDRKMARAIEMTRSLVEAGESRIGIIAMLTRQMRLLTHMKWLKAEGQALPAIEKQLALNHYGAMRMERQLPRFTADQLERGYRACVEADYAIKQGRAHDEDALGKLLLELGELVG